jgi:hypothetical protein
MSGGAANETKLSRPARLVAHFTGQGVYSLSVLSVVNPAIAALKRPKSLTERNWPLANPALYFLTPGRDFQKRRVTSSLKFHKILIKMFCIEDGPARDDERIEQNNTFPFRKSAAGNRVAQMDVTRPDFATL